MTVAALQCQCQWLSRSITLAWICTYTLTLTLSYTRMRAHKRLNVTYSSIAILNLVLFRFKIPAGESARAAWWWFVCENKNSFLSQRETNLHPATGMLLYKQEITQRKFPKNVKKKPNKTKLKTKQAPIDSATERNEKRDKRSIQKREENK